MRNLKRALSLLLSSAMVLGMLVMGSNAASYTDVTSEENVEAIEVLKAVGVMTGDENGNFNPDKLVTRAEMAVVMANLLDLKVEDFKGAKIPFTDVPEWAVPYVAACYADGITAGISATQYGSNDSVTTAQAALMMMKALGYFQLDKDFGSDWQVATVKQGSKIDIFNGISAGASAAMTRNDVAQLALNTLKATMVETDGSNTTVTLPGGIVIDTGDTKYVEVTSANTTTYNAIDATLDGTKAIVQLGEKLFDGKLTLTTSASTRDEYGVPANEWSYNGTIGKYANKAPVLTYTEGFTKKEVKNLTDAGYSFTATASSIYVNGTANAGMNVVDSTTANDTNVANREYHGNVIELYATGTDKKVIDLVVVKQGYFTEVSNINTKADPKTVTLTVYNPFVSDNTAPTVTISDNKQKSDDMYDKIVANYEKGDYLITYFTGANVAGDPIALADVTTVSGNVSAQSAIDAGYNGTITLDNTKYTFATGYFQDNNTNFGTSAVNKDTFGYSLGKDATLYLDENGFVIGSVSSVVSTNYLYVLGSEAKVETGLNGKDTVTAKAMVMLADGTVATYDLKLEKQANGDYKIANTVVYDADGSHSESDVNSAVTTALNTHAFTYTISGEKLVLGTLIAAGLSETAVSGHIYKGTTSNNGVRLNSNTTFVIYDSEKETATVVAGNTALASGTDITAGKMVVSDGAAKVVFATTSTVTSTATDEYVYIDADSYSESVKDDVHYFTYEAKDAKGATITVTAKDSALTEDGIYTYNEDNTIDSSNKAFTYSGSSWTANGTVPTAIFKQGTASVKDSLVSLTSASSTYYNLTSDTVEIYVDSTKGSVDGNSVILMLGYENGAATTTVEAVFVIA
ncbi:hypothetical protein HMPREF0866_02170 [Ruminococcaceae bacterium D16]|nr:hypothetical protein HMPREF0866_02170 [Ruminococcaceae bacterium D16]